MKLNTLFSFKAKVIKPCKKMLSKLKYKFDSPSMSLKSPTFRLRKRRTRPRIRTRVVRFRKPFSLKSLSFPQCRPKAKPRLRKHRRTLSSEFKNTVKIRHPRPAKVPKKPVPKVRIAELLTVMFSLRKAKELEEDSVDHPMTEAVTPSVSVSERGNGHEPFPSPITPGYVKKSGDSKKDSTEDSEDLEGVCRSFENYLSEMIVEEGKVKDLKDVEELLYCWRNLKSPVFVDMVCRFYGEMCKDLFSSSEESESLQTITTSE